jgi:hypothetical protein
MASLNRLQIRLDEAEMNALKNGKKAAAKLEARYCQGPMLRLKKKYFRQKMEKNGDFDSK